MSLDLSSEDGMQNASQTTVYLERPRSEPVILRIETDGVPADADSFDFWLANIRRDLRSCAEEDDKLDLVLGRIDKNLYRKVRKCRSVSSCLASLKRLFYRESHPTVLRRQLALYVQDDLDTDTYLSELTDKLDRIAVKDLTAEELRDMLGVDVLLSNLRSKPLRTKLFRSGITEYDKMCDYASKLHREEDALEGCTQLEDKKKTRGDKRAAKAVSEVSVPIADAPKPQPEELGASALIEKRSAPSCTGSCPNREELALDAEEREFLETCAYGRVPGTSYSMPDHNLRYNYAQVPTRQAGWGHGKVAQVTPLRKPESLPLVPYVQHVRPTVQYHGYENRFGDGWRGRESYNPFPRNNFSANRNYTGDTRRNAIAAKPSSAYQHPKCATCGIHTIHYGGECPALSSTCSYCRRVGHYVRVCERRISDETVRPQALEGATASLQVFEIVPDESLDVTADSENNVTYTNVSVATKVIRYASKPIPYIKSSYYDKAKAEILEFIKLYFCKTLKQTVKFESEKAIGKSFSLADIYGVSKRRKKKSPSKRLLEKFSKTYIPYVNNDELTHVFSYFFNSIKSREDENLPPFFLNVCDSYKPYYLCNSLKFRESGDLPPLVDSEVIIMPQTTRDKEGSPLENEGGNYSSLCAYLGNCADISRGECSIYHRRKTLTQLHKKGIIKLPHGVVLGNKYEELSDEMDEVEEDSSDEETELMTLRSILKVRGHFKGPKKTVTFAPMDDVCKRRRLRKLKKKAVIAATEYNSPAGRTYNARADPTKCTTKVKCLIGGVESEVLMDTGAEANLICPKFLEKLNPEYYKIRTVRPLTCILADGSLLKVDKKCYVDMIYNKTYYGKLGFHIMAGMLRPALLGTPFFSLHNKVIFTAKGPLPDLEIASLQPMKMEAISPFANMIEPVVPIASKSRRYTEFDRAFIKEEVKRMLEDGIIEEAVSPWRAQCVVVSRERKPRLVIDFSTTVNRYTVPDAYPIPLIEDIIRNVSQNKFFSTIDLKSAYHQVELRPEDRPYTGFEADSGLYQFRRLAFGLLNGVSCFQRAMDSLIRENELDGIYPYLDDLTVVGKTQAEHDENLQRFLQVAEEMNITINWEKSKFGLTKLTLLGYEIEDGTMRPDPARLEPLHALEAPPDAKAMRRMMGMLSYYAKWIPSFSAKISPLSGTTKFPLCEEKWNICKTLIEEIGAACRKTINFDKDFYVETDASEFAIAGCLHQGDYPVAYYSRLLSDSERRHSSVEKEAYAIVECLRRWRQFLYPKKFTVITDQKSVHFMFDQVHESKVKNDKIARWRLELMPFKYDIVYRPGSKNVVADILSRPTNPQLLKRIADFNERKTDCAVKGEDLLGLYTMNVSNEIDRLHRECVHAGVARTWDLIRRRNLPYSVADVRSTLAKCDICRRLKPRFHKNVPGRLIKALKPMDRVSIDFKGPLPLTQKKNRFLLVCVDEYSRYTWAFPCRDMLASTVIRNLTFLFGIFGRPQFIHSDNGTQFVSSEFKNFLTNNGIAGSTSTPYHPTGNSQVERYVGHLWKSVLLRLECLRLSDTHWDIVLEDCLHAQRNLLNTSSNRIPHEDMFRSPGNVIGNSMVIPAWLTEAKQVYVRKFVRGSRDPLVELVDVLEVLPRSVKVRYADGRIAMVSSNDVAPTGDLPEKDSPESVINSSREEAEDEAKEELSSPKEILLRSQMKLLQEKLDEEVKLINSTFDEEQKIQDLAEPNNSEEESRPSRAAPRFYGGGGAYSRVRLPGIKIKTRPGSAKTGRKVTIMDEIGEEVLGPERKLSYAPGAENHIPPGTGATEPTQKLTGLTTRLKRYLDEKNKVARRSTVFGRLVSTPAQDKLPDVTLKGNWSLIKPMPRMRRSKSAPQLNLNDDTEIYYGSPNDTSRSLDSGASPFASEGLRRDSSIRRREILSPQCVDRRPAPRPLALFTDSPFTPEMKRQLENYKQAVFTPTPMPRTSLLRQATGSPGLESGNTGLRRSSENASIPEGIDLTQWRSSPSYCDDQSSGSSGVRTPEQDRTLIDPARGFVMPTPRYPLSKAPRKLTPASSPVRISRYGRKIIRPSRFRSNLK